MRRPLRVLLGVVWVLLLSAWAWASDAGAPLYEFDDVYGTSGKGAQVIAITNSFRTNAMEGDNGYVRGTIGGRALDGLSTNADLITRIVGNLINSHDVYVLNDNPYGGNSPLPRPDSTIETIFMVVPERAATLNVGFGPSNALLDTTQNVDLEFGAYHRIIKTPLNTLSYANWEFALDKTSGFNDYDTQQGFMIFQQNPRNTPASQSSPIPMVIANVANGTAEKEPLIFRSTMREDFSGSRNGNIVAYDHFDWNVVEDKGVGGTANDWVFVPVDEFPYLQFHRNYGLKTEVTNYSGSRYALQRYDSYGSTVTLAPARWRMDIEPDDINVPDTSINLTDSSHIPPGLITTYEQNFDITRVRQNIFHLRRVDPNTGPRVLTLTHPQIFGKELGTEFDRIETTDATGIKYKTYNDYTVTGFELWNANTEFLKFVASAMGVREVAMPTRSEDVDPQNSGLLGDGHSAVEQTFVTTDAVNQIEVKATVPKYLLASEDKPAGLLPLHITLNLPFDHFLVTPRWNAFYEVWRESGASALEKLFTQHFSVYMRDASGNVTDIFKWLDARGALERTVKVFIDDADVSGEDGIFDTDGEYDKCITVSFIVMLMDGNERTMSMVRDQEVVTDNSYLVVKDGKLDGYWNMTFMSAPVNYGSTGSGSVGGGSGGGGGCSAGISVWALLAFCGFALSRKMR